MNALRSRRPSPALVVSLIALAVALGGTAYAAQSINGDLIKRQSISGSKLKKDTLTGYQVNNAKLGAVPSAIRSTHTYWAVVNNPSGANNSSLVRASDAGIAVTEGASAVTVTMPHNVTGCANVAGRNNAGTATSGAGFAQTNGSAANPNAIDVHTRDDKGVAEDADFHLIVVCP